MPVFVVSAWRIAGFTPCHDLALVRQPAKQLVDGLNERVRGLRRRIRIATLQRESRAVKFPGDAWVMLPHQLDARSVHLELELGDLARLVVAPAWKHGSRDARSSDR